MGSGSNHSKSSLDLRSAKWARSSLFLSLAAAITLLVALSLNAWNVLIALSISLVGLSVWTGLKLQQSSRRVSGDASILNLWEAELIALDEHSNISITDAQGQFLYVNSQFCQSTGFSRNELLGNTHRILKSGVHAREEYTTLWNTITGGKVWRGELCNRSKEGSLYWDAVSIIPVLGEDGAPSNFVCIRTDITERHHIQEKLLENEQLFSALANNGQSLIWTAGLDKKCNFFNEPWLRFTGRTLEQEVGDGWVEGVHPDDLQHCINTYVECFEARKSFSMNYRIRHHSGEYRWIEDAGSPRFDNNGIFLGYIGHCLDIHSHKILEASLQESEERFRLAFTTSPDSININKSSDGTYVQINEGFTRMTGYTEEDTLGKSSVALGIWVNPSERQLLIKGLRDQGSVTNLMAQFRYKDGSIHRALMSAKFITLHGEPHILSTTRDVEELLCLQDSIRLSESQMREAQHIARIGNYEFDLVNNRWTGSDMLLELFGIVKEQKQTLESWLGMIHPEDREMMVDHFQNHVLRDHNTFEKEYRIIRPSDQNEVWVYGYGNLEFDAEKVPLRMVGVIQDISRRKLIELEQMRLYQEIKDQQAEKESLIYAMSHDMRAPLVNLLGFSRELVGELKNFVDSKDPQSQAEARRNVEDCIRFITSSVERMDRLQNGVLRYARLGRIELNFQEVNIRELVDNALLPIGHQIKTKNVTIHNRIEHNCFADTSAMEQVFANLIDNAIKYSRPEFPPEITLSSHATRSRVYYHIQDNGVGIPPRLRTRVFEIFHRLSPNDAPGEGLGLTLVRGLLNRMNGNIRIADAPPPGAEFILSLPRGK